MHRVTELEQRVAELEALVAELRAALACAGAAMSIDYLSTPCHGSVGTQQGLATDPV